jgi:hypothetical protein
LRKFLPIPTNSRVFPTLSCINFRVYHTGFLMEHNRNWLWWNEVEEEFVGKRSGWYCKGREPCSHNGFMQWSPTVPAWWEALLPSVPEAEMQAGRTLCCPPFLLLSLLSQMQAGAPTWEQESSIWVSVANPTNLPREVEHSKRSPTKKSQSHSCQGCIPCWFFTATLALPILQIKMSSFGEAMFLPYGHTAKSLTPQQFPELTALTFIPSLLMFIQ